MGLVALDYKMQPYVCPSEHRKLKNDYESLEIKYKELLGLVKEAQYIIDTIGDSEYTYDCVEWCVMVRKHLS